MSWRTGWRHELAHGVATNASPYTRYAIYFQLFHVDHAQHGHETMADIWREWEGMSQFIS